jgi:hypothetical protein
MSCKHSTSASLFLLKKDFDRPEVQALFQEHGLVHKQNSVEVCQAGFLVCIGVENVEDGEWPELESSLIELGAAFDRDTEAEYLIRANVREFRPATSRYDAIDKTTYVNGIADEHVPMQKLREAVRFLGHGDTESAMLNRISELMEEYSLCDIRLGDLVPREYRHG